MTRAVCVSCGTTKHGALTPCQHCGFQPQSPTDLAKSLMLSDHNLSPDQLQAAANQIHAGQEVTFAPEHLKQLSDELSSVDMQRENAETARSINGCFLIIAIGMVCLIVLVWLII